jgi:hypothetical protein
MPTEDRFGIPDHLMDLVRIPGYVELSDDTTETSGAATAMAAAEAGVHVDGYPHGHGLTDAEDPEEFPDHQDAGDENEDPLPAPDSPDEPVPMEFEVDDVPREA